MTSTVAKAFETMEYGPAPEAAGPALDASFEALESFVLPAIDPDHRDASRFREPWVYPQLARIVTELAAMVLAEKSRNRS